MTDDNRLELEEFARPQSPFESAAAATTAEAAAANFSSAYQEWDSVIEEDLLRLGLDSSSERSESVSAIQGEDNSDFLSLPGPHENTFKVPNVPYNYLASITANFGLVDPRRLIGSGGFADVYLGITLRSKQELAVKRLKEMPLDPEEHNNMLLNYEVGVRSCGRIENRSVSEVMS